MSDTRYTRYPFERTRTYFTMSEEMYRQQGTVASEAAGLAAAPAKDIAEEAGPTPVPCLLSTHIFSVHGKVGPRPLVGVSCVSRIAHRSPFSVSIAQISDTRVRGFVLWPWSTFRRQRSQAPGGRHQLPPPALDRAPPPPPGLSALDRAPPLELPVPGRPCRPLELGICGGVGPAGARRRRPDEYQA